MMPFASDGLNASLSNFSIIFKDLVVVEAV
jgi:hypothetical protein